MLRWSAGAAALVAALRGRAADGYIYAETALYGLLFDPPVGVAVTSALLRDPEYGLDLAYISSQRRDHMIGSTGYQLAQIELAIERAAREEKARAIGERHVMDVLISYLQGPGRPQLVQGDPLRATIRELELGHGFDPTDVDGRWHGLLDASIIIQGRDLYAIDWPAETQSDDIVLWVGLSLLNELDLLGYSRRTDRVRNRVQTFAKWLPPHLDEAAEAPGYLLRPRTRLRVWGQPAVSGARDTDHLETALALHERGVDACVVTRDLGMIGRARLLGIPTHRLDDRWLLPPASTAMDA